MRQTAHQVGALRRQGALAVLRHVHTHAPATRSEVARTLGISSGSAAEITARLKHLRLLDEASAPPSVGRGRPSPTLTAHTEGPLVCAVDISHERWQIALVELGGRIIEHRSGQHASRKADDVVGQLARRITTLQRRSADRLRAVAISIAATVRGTDVAQASSLRWRRVSLEPLRPAPGTTLLVGNNASLAGLAEARRRVGLDSRVVLHLTVEVGVGGVLVVDGVPIDGATGAGGEFGHMPFGDPTLACPCGAHGCWELEIDGRGMARRLGLPPPRSPRTKAEQILAAAPIDPAARNAMTAAATALGRGIGGLVNATDPDIVSLSGLAVELAHLAPKALQTSYRSGLMRFRRSDPPALVPSTLGPTSSLIGAADVAFDSVLTPEGIDAWSDLHDAPPQS